MKPTRIDSTANPLIKEVLEINRKRSRYKHRAFLIEGPNLIEAALGEGSRATLSKVFFTAPFVEKNSRLMRMVKRSRVPLFELKDHVMKKLSDTESPQGVVALGGVKQPDVNHVTLEGLSVISDGIQDPGNMGTIIRTSEAAGAGVFVLLPGSCDPFSPKALRATAGSAFTIPIITMDREGLTKLLKRHDIPLAITTAEGGVSIFKTDLKPPVALAFGNEAGGISEELREAAATTLRIPIYGKAESLNVASAAAICIYAILRNAANQ